MDTPWLVARRQGIFLSGGDGKRQPAARVDISKQHIRNRQAAGLPAQERDQGCISISSPLSQYGARCEGYDDQRRHVARCRCISDLALGGGKVVEIGVGGSLHAIVGIAEICGEIGVDDGSTDLGSEIFASRLGTFGG